MDTYEGHSGKQGFWFIVFIYLMVIISFFDTFSQLPVISPYALELGGSSFVIGLVVGMYSFTNMIGNVLSGPWIDRLGHKKIILIGMFMAGGSLFMYVFVESATQLLWVRFVHGIGGGMLIPAVFAYMGDRTRSRTSEKGQTMAYSGAAIGISAILGPGFGGLMTATVGIEWVFVTVGILLLTMAVLVYFFLPELKIKVPEKSGITEKSGVESKRGVETNRGFETKVLLQLLQHRKLQNAYASAFGLMFTVGTLTYMLPLKVAELGYTEATTGLLMSVYGIVAIVFFVLPTGRLSDRLGRTKPMLIGLYMITLSLIWLGVFSEMALLYVGMIFFGAGFALLFPSMSAAVIDQTQEGDRGKAFGLFYAFFSLGVAIGPTLIGSFDVTPDIGLRIGAVIILAIALLIQYRSRLS